MSVAYKYFCSAVVVSALFLSERHSAFAGGFEVEETGVEKGEVELEAHGAHFNGFPAIVEIDEDDIPAGQPEPLENEIVRHGVSVEVGLGLTDWLKISGELEFEEERGEGGSFGDFELSEIGVGAKVELVELDGNGFGAAFLVEFEAPLGSEETRTVNDAGDELEVENESEGETLSFGPAITLVQGPFSATANLLFAYVFEGEKTEEEFELPDFVLEDRSVMRTPDYWNFNYAVQIKYQLNTMFGMGVEAHGEIADIGGDVPGLPGVAEPDKHRIGPVLYISLGGDDDGDDDDNGNGEEEEEEEGPEVSMAAGVLFGLTDETSDVAVKWDFDVEF